MFDISSTGAADCFDIVKVGSSIMSDGDAFTRRAARGWRPLAEAIRDARPVADCALSVEDCLARDLRETGGLYSVDLVDLLQGNSGQPSEDQIVQALRGLARRKCFDRVVPLLVGSGSESRWARRDQAVAFVEMCLDTARLDVLARALFRRPDGDRLGRPPRTRRSTLDLLNEDAPLGVNA